MRVLTAKVVGLQKETDLALLKVEAGNLPALGFSLDRAPQPGELAFAIGSPEGLQNSAHFTSIGKSTTMWLWINWVQHLLLCLIQPGGG
jgi:S1-C subfamily serine protease